MNFKLRSRSIPLNPFLVILVLVMAISISDLNASDSTFRYHYQLLGKEDQQLYKRIQDCVELCGDTLQDVPDSFAQIDHIFDYVLLDNPRFFYCLPSYALVTNTRNDIPYRHDMTFSYEKIEKKNERTRNIVDSILTILQSIDDPRSDYDIVKGVYEYLGRNCLYDEAYPDQSLYSVLVEKRGVCAGFAKSFAYIMELAGIPCVTATGTLEGQRHSWNMVRLGDNWYHIDVTASTSLADSKDAFYSFLCVSDQQLFKTHAADSNTPLPSAISGDKEYFQRNGRRMNIWIYDEFLKMLEDACSKSESTLTIKFGTQTAMDNAKLVLFGQSRIFDAFDSAGISKSTVDYSIEKELLLLSIKLK